VVERTERPDSSTRETDDRELPDVEAESLDVVIASKEVNGRRLGALARENGARGLFVLRMTRADTPLLISPETVITAAMW